MSDHTTEAAVTDHGVHTRRDFFARFLLATAVMPVGLIARLSKGSHETRPQEDWVARARSQLPVTTESKYFQTGAIGPCPQPVIDEIAERLEFQNRGPADPRYYKPMSEIEPDLRSCLAETFGVGPAGVALTHSTSEGISITAWSLNWAEGDEVIISNQEHPSNIIPWYVLRDRYGWIDRKPVLVGEPVEWSGLTHGVYSIRLVGLDPLAASSAARSTWLSPWANILLLDGETFQAAYALRGRP